MSSDNGQRFIKRNRPPRVQISYEDPTDAEKIVELPFVMGVLSDLSGNGSQVEKPPLAERSFSTVSMDNFDEFMRKVEPAVAMRVPNKLDSQRQNEKLGINLTFRQMADLEPASIARQVPALRALLEAREQLANLQRYMNGRVDAEQRLAQLLADPALMRALASRNDDTSAGASDSGSADAHSNS